MITKFEKIPPSEDTGVVAIIKFGSDGVVAHGFNRHNLDVSFACDRLLFSWAMPLDLRTWALDTKILGGKVKIGTVLERDRYNRLIRREPDFGEPVVIGHGGAGFLSRQRADGYGTDMSKTFCYSVYNDCHRIDNGNSA